MEKGKRIEEGEDLDLDLDLEVCPLCGFEYNAIDVTHFHSAKEIRGILSVDYVSKERILERIRQLESKEEEGFDGVLIKSITEEFRHLIGK